MAGVLGVLLLVALATGCSGGGTPPVLDFDGIEITIGESRPYDLTSEGYETSLAGGALFLGDLPANSWLSEFLVLEKGGKTYAYLNVYNPTREAKTVGLATLYEVRLQFSTTELDRRGETVLINGISFEGLGAERVKQAMAACKQIEVSTGSLVYKDGEYRYIFRFAEDTGLIEEVQVEMQISKSYDSV